jgi:hypothetical protein
VGTVAVTDVPGSLRPWRGALRTAAWAAFGSVALIAVQVPVFLVWPPPTDVEGFYALLVERPVLGLVSLDLLYLVNNLLVLLVYLGLFLALRDRHPSASAIALLLGTFGMAAYASSLVGFELLSLARAAAVAGPDQRLTLLAAGEGLLATYQGTAFLTYYVVNAVVLFVLAGAMVRSERFGAATAAWGLVSAALMLVPSTAGTVGRVFAIASLLPWSVFCVLVGRRLLQLAR